VEIRERGGSATIPNAPPNPAGNSAPNAAADPLPALQRSPDFQSAPHRGQQQQAPPSQRDEDPLEPPAPRGQSEQSEQQSREAEPRQSGASQEGGASVNEVVVVNRSSKPLYLAPGDVMIGGQQDRVIGDEIIVEATGKPTPIRVYCVEHGRWSQRDVAENAGYLSTVASSAGEALSADEAQKLAAEANSGKFVKGAGVVTKDVRLAVQGAMDQSKVWDEVALANAKSGAQSQSGAFTANYGDKEIAERLNPLFDAFQKPIAESPNVVGVIVAINGKPHSVDIFESTPLFQKLWPKLLKSFALDAVASNPATAAEQSLQGISGRFELEGEEIHRLHQEAVAPLREETNTQCDIAAALGFLKETCEAQVAKHETSAGVSLTRRESDSVSAFVISVVPVDDSSAGFGGGGGGGLGGGAPGPVHAAGFSK
jgi:hypothetical protein